MGKMFYISRGRLKRANKQFTTMKNDYELNLTEETEVEECLEDVKGVPTFSYSFVPIQDIEAIEPNTLIDVIGVCRNVSELTTKSNKMTSKRDIQLVDRSGRVVQCTLWGAEAESFDGSQFPVVAIKGCKVSDFGGKSLTTQFSSLLLINSDIPEAHQLHSWYDNVGKNEELKSISRSGMDGGGGDPQSEPLTDPPKFQDLMEEVAACLPRKWAEVAIKLGLKHEIERIEVLPNAIPNCCYREVFSVWEKNTPKPYCWATIVKALKSKLVDEPGLASSIESRIQSMPLTKSAGTSLSNWEQNKLKRNFDAALKHGYIVARHRKILLVGVTGSGKSSLLRLLLGEDPPQVRQSTPCAARPVRAVRIDSTTTDLTRMGPKELMAALADVVRAYTSQKKHESTEQSTACQNNDIRTCTSQKEQEHSSVSQNDDKVISDSSLKLPDTPEASSQDSSVSSEQPTSELTEGADSVFQTQMDKEILTLLRRPYADKEILEVDWTYIIDTGGQPQFMEVLPALLRGTYLTICVLKLCEELSAYPMIEYHDGGRLLCQPIQSAQINEQFLKNLTSSMKSFRSKGQPSILFVGTHRDREHECTEKREEKEKRIFEIVIPTLEDSVVFCSEALKQFIFAINAKNPEDIDKRVAKDIRMIILHPSSAQTNKLPLQWYWLELKLGERAELLGRRVLKKAECFSIAQKLYFTSEESFEAALRYLNNLNILSYYPDILPDIVFCDPQVLLDKITELVELSYRLRDSPKPLATHGKYRKFRDRGIVTMELLEEECFSKHYSPSVFSPSELVTLLRGLLIFADFDEAFFMPCLLPWLDDNGLSEYRVSMQSTPAPLILNLPDGPQNGLFCSLTTSLLSAHDGSPVSAALVVDPTSQIPVCLYRNCIQLTIPKYPGHITLINSINYIEVHVTCPPEYGCSLSKVVCDTVLVGLDKAANRLGYGKLTVAKSFFCPCLDGSSHLATLGVENSWICSRYPITCGKLEMNQKIWVESPGRMQKRRTEEPDGATGENGYRCLKKAKLQEPEKAVGGGKEEFGLAYLSGLPVAARWDELGVQLGVPEYQLDSIQRDHVGHPNQSQCCLHSMFSWWLKNSDYPIPEYLATALSNIGETKVAASITQKYIFTNCEKYF